MTAHNDLHALLFQATGAEYAVLCMQTYQLARHALLNRLAAKTFRQPAVIFDLDETVLDNSAYQAWLIKEGRNFDEKTTWRAWCQAGESEAVPGAVEFVRFVEAAGVKPIFITSREEVTRQATAKNLTRLSVLAPEDLDVETVETKDVLPRHPFETRLFMKGMSDVSVPHPSGPQIYQLGNKFYQRVFCEQVRGFEIILSVGDQLADYAEYYGGVNDATGKPVSGQFPTVAYRRLSALQDMSLFGRDFVLMPNATYGGWLRAFESNKLGAGDELAQTGEPVRQALVEPLGPFCIDEHNCFTAVGPKLSEKNLRVWKGPSGQE